MSREIDLAAAERDLLAYERQITELVERYSGWAEVSPAVLLERAASLMSFYKGETPAELLHVAYAKILQERERGQKTFATVTSVDYLDSLREDADEGSNWTLGKNSNPRKGDRLLLYCKAPISGFVATARIASMPKLITEADHEFRGSYCADIDEIRLLDTYVLRKTIMEAIPEWGWPVQPRTCVQVPDAFVEELMELIEVNQ